MSSAETFVVGVGSDLVRVRRAVAERAAGLGLSDLDRTRLVTAASELARNMLDHAGGGEARVETVERDGRRGVRLTFEDRGPGIADLELALSDGYSSGRGLGLGLGGARRLCEEFEIDSRPGEGTRITVARWCR